MTHQISNAVENHVYIFIRTDLPPEQITVQTAHAAIVAAQSFFSDEQALSHPNLVVCSIRNEEGLHRAIAHLERNGVRFRTFIEPDRGNEMTAVATEPIFEDKRKIFKKFQCLKFPASNLVVGSCT